jgi:polysaccharide export outer membrane protein
MLREQTTTRIWPSSAFTTNSKLHAWPMAKSCLLARVLVVLFATQLTGFAQLGAQRAEQARAANAAPQAAPGGYYGSPEGRMEMVDPDKKLSAGDELTFQIEEDPDGGMPRVVTATGAIEVPELGRVHVAGKTTSEAAAEIKRLLEKDYYHKATVRLSIDRVNRNTVRAGQILLSGEVRAVGSLDLIAGEPLTISQAILKAGGVREFGDDRRVQVTRSEGGATSKRLIDVKRILKNGDVRDDITLQDGDRIFVPRVGFKF